MLCGQLEVPDTYAPFLTGPVWAEALAWLRAMPPDLAPGIHPLRGDRMYANVHGYETRPREACRYESHRRHVDLQFCIRGGECIEWQPRDLLVPLDEYNVQKDVVHYQAPRRPAGIVTMGAGIFAVFRPEDGHMPKLTDGIHAAVEKVVIKIDVNLVF